MDEFFESNINQIIDEVLSNKNIGSDKQKRIKKMIVDFYIKNKEINDMELYDLLSREKLN